MAGVWRFHVSPAQCVHACVFPLLQVEASSQELLGNIAYNQGDFYRAGRCFDKSLVVWEQVKNTQRCAVVAYMVRSTALVAMCSCG